MICIIINESELRHEMRSRQGDLKKLMIKLSQNHQSNYVVVTEEKKALFSSIIKKMNLLNVQLLHLNWLIKLVPGMLYVAHSIYVFKSKLNDNVSLWYGSLAAAQSVESISNSKHVDKTEMLKTIRHALK